MHHLFYQNQNQLFQSQSMILLFIVSSHFLLPAQFFLIRNVNRQFIFELLLLKLMLTFRFFQSFLAQLFMPLPSFSLLLLVLLLLHYHNHFFFVFLILDFLLDFLLIMFILILLKLLQLFLQLFIWQLQPFLQFYLIYQ